MRVITFFCAFLLTCFYSCKNAPSDDDIKRCLLKDYVCGEYAKVNSMTIVNSSEREFMGINGMEYIVDGEIEWTTTCQSMIVKVMAGHKETFINKKVFVRKMDKGWTCNTNE